MASAISQKSDTSTISTVTPVKPAPHKSISGAYVQYPSLHSYPSLIDSSARHYTTELYTLKVGPSQYTFNVHKSVLCLSPVLACMCQPNFLEGVTKEIVLPEDDPDSIGRIIHHLYGNSRAVFSFDSMGLAAADRLADMYSLAEKYQLPKLKTAIISTLKETSLKNDRVAFFEIASQICCMTNEKDSDFHAYFESQALLHLPYLVGEQLDKVAETMSQGGVFASKMFRFQASLLRKRLDRESIKPLISDRGIPGSPASMFPKNS